MLTTPNKQRGLSLVELLVGIAILAILASLAAPSFRAWLQNNQLRATSESIMNGLQLARAEAVRRNTSVSLALTGATLQNWTVGCVTPVADLNADGLPDCPAVIQSYSGKESTANAQVNANGGPTTVIYTGLGRASNTMNLSVTNPTGGACKAGGGDMRCLNITVAQGGQVRMCNPALPTSNPQGC